VLVVVLAVLAVVLVVALGHGTLAPTRPAPWARHAVPLRVLPAFLSRSPELFPDFPS